MAEPTQPWKLFQELFNAEEYIVDSSGNITSTGAQTITGDVTITGSFAVTGQSLLTGAVNVVGALGVNGDATMTAGKDIVMSKTGQASFSKLQLAVLNTAPASAGLTKGDMWMHKVTTDIYRLAVCISTATGASQRVRRALAMDVTLGSAS